MPKVDVVSTITILLGEVDHSVTVAGRRSASTDTDGDPVPAQAFSFALDITHPTDPNYPVDMKKFIDETIALYAAQVRVDTLPTTPELKPAPQA